MAVSLYGTQLRQGWDRINFIKNFVESCEMVHVMLAMA